MKTHLTTLSAIGHLLEDPQTLQIAMEMKIRQTLTSISSRHCGRVPTRTFLTSMAPVIFRDPAVFMRAAAAVCQLESSGARTYIVLLKEKEEKEDRVKAAGVENRTGSSSNEGIRMPEIYSKLHDGSEKLSKRYKRVPHSLAQVIDQLLEIIMSYPLPRKHEHCLGSDVYGV